jgi:crossover junction endodeoxyribonuclease RusA
MKTLRIDVRGLPRPQGSMLAHPTRTKAGGNGVALRYPPGVIVWRAQVQQAIATALVGEEQFTGAVTLHLGFDLPRPQDHFGTGRNSTQVKASSPRFPLKAPDLDKLIRAICDAATDAGAWHDDAQVVTILAHKRFSSSQPGVLIRIQEVV